MRMKTIICGIFAALLLFSGNAIFIEAEEPNHRSGTTYLYTGSPLILSGDKIHMLDSTNPDVSATVVNGKTLLPLRAVSEFFGAEVSYDQLQKKAMIQYGGKNFVFPIGQKKYIVDELLGDREVLTDVESVILEGRTMVPLRVICEQILEKKVSYHNRVIAISDQPVNLQNQPALVKQVRDKIGHVVKARSMYELEQALSQNQGRVNYSDKQLAVDREAEMVSKSAGLSAGAEISMQASENASAVADSIDNGYSSTNVQVEGVDEADVVKTDGNYIYIGGNNVVRIIRADQGKLDDATSIKLSTDKYVSEIYVADGKLAILGTRTEQRENKRKTAEPFSLQIAEDKAIGIMPPYYSVINFSFVDIYDISNPAKPIYLKGHEIEGSYQSSRKKGDIIYLVTNWYSRGDSVLPMTRDTIQPMTGGTIQTMAGDMTQPMSGDTIQPKTGNLIQPMATNKVNGNDFVPMKLSDIMIIPERPATGYLIISAINVSNQQKTELEAVTAYGMTMYMNDTSMYLAADGAGDNTQIIKFKLEGMKVGYAGSGEVKGHLINQFAMDEYEGNLRVATTSWGNENALYVLDSSLYELGAVTGLAKGETIYSVRFMGDKGYIVTFRTIDPLFVFDLSNPEKPVVTGELKIPGFSSYLHPVGENLLLGIGSETYEIYRKDERGKDVVVGTRQGGIKYSLFDVSDMGKPKEISKFVIGDSGSWSEALHNHKAIMVDRSEQIAAMDANLYFEQKETGYRQGAIIMSYQGKKLALKGFLESEPSGVYGNDIPYARRILYIGDELYYVQDGRVTSYDYESLKKIDDLVLR